MHLAKLLRKTEEYTGRVVLALQDQPKAVKASTELTALLKQAAKTHTILTIINARRS